VFLVVSEDGSVTFAHKNAERLLGFPPPVLLGINAFSFFHVDDVPTVMSIISEAMSRSRESRAVELRVRADGDSWRTVTLSASVELAHPDDGGIAFRLRGPEAVVQAADQIARLALHDRVTGLPSRALFVDRIDHAVTRAERGSQSVVLLAAGFNGYVAASPREAGDVSDELVVAVARRLRSCLRASDTVARLSFDEFGILLEDIGNADHVSVIVQRIFQAMDVPFSDGGADITVVPSIGMVASSPERNRAADLLRAASVARAWAGVQGSGGYAPFDPTMAPPEGEDSTSQYRFASLNSCIPGSVGSESEIDDVASLHQRLARLEETIASLAGLVSTTSR
jgi:diguanylate cyclase (GGDEF)-like protein